MAKFSMDFQGKISTSTILAQIGAYPHSRESWDLNFWILIAEDEPVNWFKFDKIDSKNQKKKKDHIIF